LKHVLLFGPKAKGKGGGGGEGRREETLARKPQDFETTP